MTAHTRSHDPWTSYAAARSIAITEGQAAVLHAFAQHGEMTDERLVRLSPGLSPSGARSRRSELVHVGLIRDTGRTVIGSTGRHMIVWELAGYISESEQRMLWGDR